MLQRQERGDQCIYGTNAKSARGKENRRAVARQVMLTTHLLFVLVLSENRIDGDTCDHNLGWGNTESFQIGTRFINWHKVLLIVMDQPHRMDVKIGDHYRLTTLEASLCLKPRHDLGR